VEKTGDTGDEDERGEEIEHEMEVKKEKDQERKKTKNEVKDHRVSCHLHICSLRKSLTPLNIHSGLSVSGTSSIPDVHITMVQSLGLVDMVGGWGVGGCKRSIV
jgi:hypothetical protein